jgi:hypothetical protein
MKLVIKRVIFIKKMIASNYFKLLAVIRYFLDKSRVAKRIVIY